MRRTNNLPRPRSTARSKAFIPIYPNTLPTVPKPSRARRNHPFFFAKPLYALKRVPGVRTPPPRHSKNTQCLCGFPRLATTFYRLTLIQYSIQVYRNESYRPNAVRTWTAAIFTTRLRLQLDLVRSAAWLFSAMLRIANWDLETKYGTTPQRCSKRQRRCFSA